MENTNHHFGVLYGVIVKKNCTSRDLTGKGKEFNSIKISHRDNIVSNPGSIFENKEEMLSATLLFLAYNKSKNNYYIYRTKEISEKSQFASIRKTKQRTLYKPYYFETNDNNEVIQYNYLGQFSLTEDTEFHTNNSIFEIRIPYYGRYVLYKNNKWIDIDQKDFDLQEYLIKYPVFKDERKDKINKALLTINQFNPLIICDLVKKYQTFINTFNIVQILESLKIQLEEIIISRPGNDDSYSFFEIRTIDKSVAIDNYLREYIQIGRKTIERDSGYTCFSKTPERNRVLSKEETTEIKNSLIEKYSSYSHLLYYLENDEYYKQFLFLKKEDFWNNITQIATDKKAKVFEEHLLYKYPQPTYEGVIDDYVSKMNEILENYLET
ncbi:MAG: hypothetical protein MJZ22_02685 [Candidatus Saccharibacteria bacterium]|nr:hypothetical protein [Candidatus Saccharibacteria bacterium]